VGARSTASSPPTDRSDAHRPNLATALINQSERHSDLGRTGEGLAAIEEAAPICRQLATDRPDVHRPTLATALNSQSCAYPAWDGTKKPWPRSKESVTIRRPAHRRPAHCLQAKIGRST
jgi:hypothetical protein